MKIPRELPLFRRTVAVIITTGEHAAHIYVAHDGELEEREQLLLPRRVYSDREGHFMTKSRGKVWGSGSVYEPKKEAERVDFLRAFTTHLKKHVSAREIDEVYLLAPQHDIERIGDAVPASLRKKIALRIAGNYTKKRPFDILKKIKMDIERLHKRAPLDPEARAILEKSNIARHVVKGKPEV